MSDEDDKIIRPSFGDPKLVVDRNDKPYCGHEYLVLRERSRVAICRVCKEIVDPFNVLLGLSRNWDWAVHHSREIDDRLARIEELKREEQNLKGRLRSGYAKLEEPRIQAYFEEYLRRLNAANTHKDIWAVRDWVYKFRWLNGEQVAALREAEIQAKRRAEDHDRTTTRKRGMKVIDGGRKGGGAA